MKQERGIQVALIEGEKTILETAVFGCPSYKEGDEISLVTGYRRGIHPSKLPVTIYRVVSLTHLIRRVEQPHEVMRYEVCLQVRVEPV